MKRYLVLSFLLLLMIMVSGGCQLHSSNVMEEAWVEQGETLINNHIWYHGTYSELYDLAGRDTMFELYVDEAHRQIQLVYSSEQGYISVEYVAHEPYIGADLPNVRFHERKEALLLNKMSFMGEISIHLIEDAVPHYVYDEFKTFDLLDMLSIINIQLSKDERFKGKYNVYVKNFHEGAITSDIVIINGNSMWLAEVRMDIDRPIEDALPDALDITEAPINKLIKLDTERLRYYARQIMLQPFHEEIMEFPSIPEPDSPVN